MVGIIDNQPIKSRPNNRGYTLKGCVVLLLTPFGKGGQMASHIVFGFDYGSRRIGIAVGQMITKSANPLKQLPNNKGGPDWHLLDKLVREWQPERFIVGLPLNMDDSPSKMSQEAQAFARKLSEHYTIPAEFIDERLSSREAKERLLEQGETSPSKEQINTLSAQIILESWLRLV